MASSGGQLYFCHACERNVRPPAGGELACPSCQGDFLEEVESAPHPFMLPLPFMDGTESPGPGRSRAGGAPYSSPFGEVFAFLQQMHTAQFQQNPDGSGRQRPGPAVVLQSQIPNMPLGGNFEIYLDNGTGEGIRRLPGNFGDYFWGPGLDQLIQQLTENDPNRYGAPPASKAAIKAMPTISISEQQLGTDAAHCAVCKDAFELGTEVKQMPCLHLYHADCILPWLQQHNSCPVCRYEMPTDDPEYDQARARGSGVSGSAGPGGPAGFTVWGVPGQLNTGQFARGAEGWTEAGGQQVLQSGGPPSGTTEGWTEAGGQQVLQSGVPPGGSGFSISIPWFRNGTAVSQSAANAQAGSSSQANSGETVSSVPAGEGMDTPGQTSRCVGAEDDGDRVMTEAHHEDLD